jgi:GDPmannose 4,6-dehydratase
MSSRGLEWQKYVEVDQRFLRPAGVDLLVDDAPRACTERDWRPEGELCALVTMMVDADVQRLTANPDATSGIEGH